jgi:hypothetical protein
VSLKLIKKNKININISYIKVNQTMDKNIWKSFKDENFDSRKGIRRKTLKKDQIIEFDLIKNLSEKLIIGNFNRNPTFKQIRKTFNGYFIQRRCYLKSKYLCGWSINLNINTNEALLSCGRVCEHTNLIKCKD